MITHRASRKRSIRLLTHLHNELSVICTRNLSETFQKARSCDFIAISRIVFKALRSNPKRHGWPRLLQLASWLTKLVFPWRDIECGGTCDPETMEIQKVVFEEVCSATRAEMRSRGEMRSWGTWVWSYGLGFASALLTLLWRCAVDPHDSSGYRLLPSHMHTVQFLPRTHVISLSTQRVSHLVDFAANVYTELPQTLLWRDPYHPPLTVMFECATVAETLWSPRISTPNMRHPQVMS